MLRKPNPPTREALRYDAWAVPYSYPKASPNFSSWHGVVRHRVGEPEEWVSWNRYNVSRLLENIVSSYLAKKEPGTIYYIRALTEEERITLGFPRSEHP